MKRGRVVQFPRSDRPIEAINFLSVEAADPEVEGVVVVVTRKDGSLDLRCFGNARRRDVVFACAVLTKTLIEQGDD